MAITLYGFSQSRSFRCLWALHEAKLEHQYVELNFGSDQPGGSRSPEYLSINVQGKAPSMVHDDFVITESAAILNYIGHLAKGAFIPADPKLRAKYDELSFFILSELEQPLWTTGKHRFALPEEHRVAEIFPTAKWEFDKALKALANITDVSEFTVGDSFSFADVLLAQTFNWADRFEFELPADYLEFRDRMFARPAAQQALAQIK